MTVRRRGRAAPTLGAARRLGGVAHRARPRAASAPPSPGRRTRSCCRRALRSARAPHASGSATQGARAAGRVTPVRLERSVVVGKRRTRRTHVSRACRGASRDELHPTPSSALVASHGRARAGTGARRRLQPARLPSCRWRPEASTTSSLARGSSTARSSVWPEERRLLNGAVLSDHAPVEMRVG